MNNNNTFEKIKLDPYDIQTFQCSLVSFSSEQVQVKGYTTYKKVRGLNENPKIIMVM